MLERPIDRLPAAKALPGGVQYEQKWDGYRVVAFSGDGVYRQSKRRANLTAAFTEVAMAVGRLPTCVVDGEVVIWGEGALDFPALLQRMGSSTSRARRLAAARPASFVVSTCWPWTARICGSSRFDNAVIALNGWSGMRAGVGRGAGDAGPRRGERVVVAIRGGSCGIEGIVATGLGQPYRGGSAWLVKYRYSPRSSPKPATITRGRQP